MASKSKSKIPHAIMHKYTALSPVEIKLAHEEARRTPGNRPHHEKFSAIVKQKKKELKKLNKEDIRFEAGLLKEMRRTNMAKASARQAEMRDARFIAGLPAKGAFSAQASPWARAVREGGRPYFKAHPFPPGGFMEYGRAGFLKHPESARRTWIEQYDPSDGQVYIMPRAVHATRGRKRSAESIAKGKATRAANRAARAGRTEGSSYR